MSRKITCIIIITIYLFFYTPVYASTAGLDAKGNELLVTLRAIGYWIILFVALKDVIKEAMHKDIKGVGSIVLKYVLIYACLFFLPWALHQVEGIF